LFFHIRALLALYDGLALPDRPKTAFGFHPRLVTTAQAGVAGGGGGGEAGATKTTSFSDRIMHCCQEW